MSKLHLCCTRRYLQSEHCNWLGQEQKLASLKNFGMDLHTRIPLARSGNQSLKEANVNFRCYNFAMRRIREETITSNASFETRNYRSNCSTAKWCIFLLYKLDHEISNLILECLISNHLGLLKYQKGKRRNRFHERSCYSVTNFFFWSALIYWFSKMLKLKS